MAVTKVSELSTMASTGSSPIWMATSPEPTASSPPMVAELATGSSSKLGSATMAMSETSAEAGTVTETVSAAWMSKSKNSSMMTRTVVSSSRMMFDGRMPGRMMLFQPVVLVVDALMPLIRSVVGPSPKSSIPTASTHVSSSSAMVSTTGLPEESHRSSTPPMASPLTLARPASGLMRKGGRATTSYVVPSIVHSSGSTSGSPPGRVTVMVSGRESW